MSKLKCECNEVIKLSEIPSNVLCIVFLSYTVRAEFKYAKNNIFTLSYL